MEWWTGMQSCGANLMADMNQIEAGIFDPWINGDDLDLGTILHQANSSTSTSSTTSSSSPLPAQAVLTGCHQLGCGTNGSCSSSTSTTSGQTVLSNGSPASNSSDGNNCNNSGNSHMQSYALLCNSNNNGLFNQQQHLHQLHQNYNHYRQQQQQHLQPHLSSTTNVSCESMHNIFNITGKVAANAISSEARQNHQILASSASTSTSPSTCTTAAQAAAATAATTTTTSTSTITSIDSANIKPFQLQKVISTSECSSISSTGGSMEPSPANSQTTNYLSSPPSSSLVLTPETFSLLMFDPEGDHKTGKANEQLLHQPMHLQHHNLAYGHPIDCYNEQQQVAMLQHAHHQGQPIVLNNDHRQPAPFLTHLSTIGPECNDLVDSKSGLLLMESNNNNNNNTNNNNCETAANESRSYDSVSCSHGQISLDGGQGGTGDCIDGHLIFVCSQPQSSPSSSSAQAVDTHSSANSANDSSVVVSSRSSGQHDRSQQNGSDISTNATSQYKPRSSSTSTSSSDSSTPSSTPNPPPPSKSNKGVSATTEQSGSRPKTRRNRHITDYVLADEEKRLLVKEGYTDFPMNYQTRPLSTSEERILRKVRRKIRNKKSAQCSRQRRKEYVEDLERKYEEIIRENNELKNLLLTYNKKDD